MSYIDKTLSDGESVVERFRFHWVAWLPMGGWLLLAIPTLGVTLVLALYEYLRLRCTEQGVTDKRVIFKKGIISRQTEEMRLGSIETVEITQSIPGRILGFGTVEVTGRGVSDVIFRKMDAPIRIKRAIENLGKAD